MFTSKGILITQGWHIFPTLVNTDKYRPGENVKQW